MNELIHCQKFGIEIEMTGLTRKSAAYIISDVLGSHCTVTHTGGSYDEWCVQDHAHRAWKLVNDASISVMNHNNWDAVEFVTPPLQYDDIPILEQMVCRLRQRGATVNSSCGIHIHIDGARHTPESLSRIVNFMVARQSLIYESLEIRDRGNRWCKKLNKELLTRIRREPHLTARSLEMIWYSEANDGYDGGIDHRHYNPTRYHGVNLHAYFTKGTIEFRLFNSTLNPEKILTYIQFCLAVSGWAISAGENIKFKDIGGYTSEQKVVIMRNMLIRRLGLSGDEYKICRKYLLRPLYAPQEAVVVETERRAA